MKKNLIFYLLFFVVVPLIYGDFSLQTDSFKTEKRARTRLSAIAKLLGTETEALHIVKTDLGDKGIWYRVRFGRFQDKKNAAEYLVTLKDKGIPSFVTTFNGPPSITVIGSKTNVEERATVKQPEEKVNSKQFPKKIKPKKKKTVQLRPKNPVKTAKDKKTDKEILDETLDFKINILNNIWIKAVQERDITQIKSLIPRYLKLAEEFFDSDNLYKTYYMVSHCYLEMKDNNRSVTYMDKAIDYAPRREKAALLYEKGFIVYIFIQDYDKALNIFKRVSIEFPGTDWEQAAILNIKEILTYKVYKANEEGS